MTALAAPPAASLILSPKFVVVVVLLLVLVVVLEDVVLEVEVEVEVEVQVVVFVLLVVLVVLLTVLVVVVNVEVFVVVVLTVEVVVSVVDVVVVVDRNLWKHHGTCGTCEALKQQPRASHDFRLMPLQPQLVFASLCVAQSWGLGAASLPWKHWGTSGRAATSLRSSFQPCRASQLSQQQP